MITQYLLSLPPTRILKTNLNIISTSPRGIRCVFFCHQFDPQTLSLPARLAFQVRAAQTQLRTAKPQPGQPGDMAATNSAKNPIGSDMIFEGTSEASLGATETASYTELSLKKSNGSKGPGPWGIATMLELGEQVATEQMVVGLCIKNMFD